MVEEVFVAKVIADGKVTIPLRVRDLLGIRDGDYARVSLVEVIKKTEKTETRRRRAKRRVKPAVSQ